MMCCADCRDFTRDTIGDGNGIGSCNTMESWLDKFPRRRPKPAVYDENYKKLGEELEEIERTGELSVRFTGPWAVFSFV